VGEEAEGTGLKGIILPLDRAALSVALGRDNVVHLALTDDAAAARVPHRFSGCCISWGVTKSPPVMSLLRWRMTILIRRANEFDER
jgi:hypothetical protein